MIFSSIFMMIYASDGFEVKYNQPQVGVHQLVYTPGEYVISGWSFRVWPFPGSNSKARL